jgi:hypothetical protein
MTNDSDHAITITIGIGIISLIAYHFLCLAVVKLIYLSAKKRSFINPEKYSSNYFYTGFVISFFAPLILGFLSLIVICYCNFD